MTREEYEKSLNYVVNGEQQLCNDAISRQAVIDGINEYFHDEYYQRTSIQDCRDCLIKDVIKDMPSVTPQQKMGHWIETAKEYYKAINEEGGGVNENTPYFTDDIACSECLTKFSVIDNETECFEYCPNCGAKMIEPQEGGDEVNEVLDKIRAEIKAMSGDIETIADVLQIIDKYKAESEVKE